MTKLRRAYKLRRTARQQGYHISFRLAWRIVAAADDTDVPAYYLAALVDQETGFKFIFGHDPGGLFPGERVTKAKYRALQESLRAGRGGANGVGYGQPTFSAFITGDDALWRPKHNLRWSAKFQKQLGLTPTGFNEYNGDPTGGYGRARVALNAVYRKGMK